MFDYYQTANIIGSAVVPGAINVLKNSTGAYFAKYLLEKAISVFKWKLPETWNRDYFLYVLYAWGYIAVVETNKYGVICQAGVPYG